MRNESRNASKRIGAIGHAQQFEIGLNRSIVDAAPLATPSSVTETMVDPHGL